MAVYTWDFGHDRKLVVNHESLVGGTKEFVLHWKDELGNSNKQVLCNFPVRGYEGSTSALLTNDDRRLIFAWGAHVVCVDVRELHQLPGTQPSKATLEEQKRDESNIE